MEPNHLIFASGSYPGETTQTPKQAATFTHRSKRAPSHPALLIVMLAVNCQLDACIKNRAQAGSRGCRSGVWCSVRAPRIHAAPRMVACDIVHAEGLGYKSVRRRCVALERQCFSASEAMNIERESGHTGAVLLCATRPGGGDEDVAGYLLLHRAAPATLAKLAVAPRYRRQGVGRALVEAALAMFRTTTHDECVLQVDEANAAAQRLYESVGFRVCRRREHYYCDRQSSDCESGVGCRHALEMRLSLTPSLLAGAPAPANGAGGLSTGSSRHV